jgi:hypothetical protein
MGGCDLCLILREQPKKQKDCFHSLAHFDAGGAQSTRLIRISTLQPKIVCSKLAISFHDFSALDA